MTKIEVVKITLTGLLLSKICNHECFTNFYLFSAVFHTVHVGETKFVTSLTRGVVLCLGENLEAGGISEVKLNSVPLHVVLVQKWGAG